jgi:L-alanine-DL-glutamate epimerase-like enolase superfamily enzyme
MAINGESIDTCFVVARYISKVLIGMDPLNIKTCSRAMDRLIYGNSSIKSAFDMAMYDIASQYAGQPLYEFLGGTVKKDLETDMTVSIGEPGKMADDALRYKEQGFPAIKVKLGETTVKDVERIHAIRQAIGDEIPLRIDANQGWKPAVAIETLNQLSPYRIQHCEEPIPRWNFMKLKKVRKNSPIPIMADESVCDHHDAKRLVELEACDLFNIKLGKSSGIYKAKKIMAIADGAGIKMQLGAFMESRLAITAAAHLALCNENILYCDFDTPLMFTEDGKKGRLVVNEQPGIGASLEETYLRRLEHAVYS